MWRLGEWRWLAGKRLEADRMDERNGMELNWYKVLAKTTGCCTLDKTQVACWDVLLGGFCKHVYQAGLSDWMDSGD